MSAPHDGSLTGQLRGHTATFLVGGRETNLAFARAVLSRLAEEGQKCAVLDVDALYSSNAGYVFGPLSQRQAEDVSLLVPEPGTDVESDLAELAGSFSGRTIIIDSLNSLYHLLSIGGKGYRGRKLTFTLACLSYLATTGGCAVLATMYQRDRTMRLGGGRRISDMTDMAYSTSLSGKALTLRCERGALSGRTFSLAVT